MGFMGFCSFTQKLNPALHSWRYFKFKTNFYKQTQYNLDFFKAPVCVAANNILLLFLIGGLHIGKVLVPQL